MSRRRFTPRLLVVTVIAALQLALTPTIPASAPAASLSGHVISADSQAPLTGALVRVLDPRTGDLYTSMPTDDKGGFLVEDLPASTYNLAIQDGPGVFTAGAPIALEPGQQRSVMVAVHQNATAASPEEARKQQKKYKTSVWENPLTATLIVLGIAVVLGVTIDQISDNSNKEVIASQSVP